MNSRIRCFDNDSSVGWMPVDCDAAEDPGYRGAFERRFTDGTYELIGAKAQGNPEKQEKPILLNHDEAEIYLDAPRSCDAQAVWLKDKDIEGLVIITKMAKIKKRDFGRSRS